MPEEPAPPKRRGRPKKAAETAIVPVAPAPVALPRVPDLWERQSYDSEESWDAFVRYRDAKAPRRLVVTDAGGIRIPTAQLAKWCSEHNWPARVEAYDRHMDRIVVAEREAFLAQHSREIAAEHMAALKDARELVLNEARKLLEQSMTSPLAVLKPGELNKILENVVKLERLLRGQTTETIGAAVVDLSKLPIEDLRQLEEIRQRLENGNGTTGD